MKITEVRVVDNAFFEVHIETGGGAGALVVTGESIHSSVPLLLDGAQWQETGECALSFLLDNHKEIVVIMSDAIGTIQSGLHGAE